jgi:hypothetical protein
MTSPLTFCAILNNNKNMRYQINYLLSSFEKDYSIFINFNYHITILQKDKKSGER